MRPVLVHMPADLVEKIDAAAGPGKRSEWIRKACERGLIDNAITSGPKIRRAAAERATTKPDGSPRPLAVGEVPPPPTPPRKDTGAKRPPRRPRQQDSARAPSAPPPFVPDPGVVIRHGPETDVDGVLTQRVVRTCSHPNERKMGWGVVCADCGRRLR